MTLQEKFDMISCKDCDMPFCDNKCTMLSDGELNRLEQIADEFAIEFAEWINDNCWNIEADRFLYEEEQYRYKELLEIFKKEKGL